MYSAMKPAEFQKQRLRAQAKFSAATRLTRSTGEPLVVTNWQWPEPARAHALRQARAMQPLVQGLAKRPLVVAGDQDRPAGLRRRPLATRLADAVSAQHCAPVAEPHKKKAPGVSAKCLIIRLTSPTKFPTESGRREWTRTNDPHHVKVVL